MFKENNLTEKIIANREFSQIPSLEVGDETETVGLTEKPQTDTVRDEKPVTDTEREQRVSEKDIVTPDMTLNGPETNVSITPEQLKFDREKAAAGMNYDRIIDEVRSMRSQYAPEDEATRKKRERTEKSKKIIGAVSDGLRALGNLYFTSQYSPDMYKGSTSMLERLNRHYEKAKAERERNADAYFNYSMKIGDLQNQKARTLREMEAQHEQQKIARERQRLAEEAAKRDAALHQFKVSEAKSKAEGAGYDAQTKKAAADAAPEQQKIKTDNLRLDGRVKESTIRKNDAQTNKAYRDTNKKPYHFDGREYTKDEDPDYRNAITRAVDKANTYFAKKDASGKIIKDEEGKVVYRDDYEPIKVSYEDANGNMRYYDWAQTAAKTERALELMRQEQNDENKRKKPNPMVGTPNSSNGKKANPMI